MNRIFCVDSAIKSVNGLPLLGTAFTLHLPSGDNLLFHKALDMAQPGDVLVMACGGMERSYCGELMMMCARNRSLAGFAIDGCIRDIDEASRMDFPVFAKGVTPQGPYKFGPGEINVPIAFGGQVVFPGDIVVGDKDGIIFIRPSEADEILQKSWAQNDKETALHARYDTGDTVSSYSKDIMDKALQNLNCQIIEDFWR
jgi:regulator of RNase E activity RraA